MAQQRQDHGANPSDSAIDDHRSRRSRPSCVCSRPCACLPAAGATAAGAHERGVGAGAVRAASEHAAPLRQATNGHYGAGRQSHFHGVRRRLHEGLLRAGGRAGTATIRGAGISKKPCRLRCPRPGAHARGRVPVHGARSPGRRAVCGGRGAVPRWRQRAPLSPIRQRSWFPAGA